MPQALPIPGPGYASPSGTEGRVSLAGDNAGRVGQGGGLLRVVSPSDIKVDANTAARRDSEGESEERRTAGVVPDLAAHVRYQWEIMRNHRNQGTDPLNNRLLRAQRMYEGIYDSDKLGQIEAFGGSTVYARLAAAKCRGGSALLREVYLGAERPWALEAEKNPPVPQSILDAIDDLLEVEMANAHRGAAQGAAAQADHAVMLHAAGSPDHANPPGMPPTPAPPAPPGVPGGAAPGGPAGAPAASPGQSPGVPSNAPAPAASSGGAAGAGPPAGAPGAPSGGGVGPAAPPVIPPPAPAQPAPTDNDLHMRRINLIHAAEQAARRAAEQQANDTADHMQDILNQGNFYDAFREFLVDLPLFPFAVLHGPVVRMAPKIVWRNGRARRQMRARMFWERVAPFDLYWTPGASKIADSDFILRMRLTRADLNDLIGLPGYREEAIRAVLVEYGRGGLYDWLDTTDNERALREDRENPALNRSRFIDAVEFNGSVQGDMLISYGVTAADNHGEEIDPELDYRITTWLIGRHIIKVQIDNTPRQAPTFYVTSYEKVPGTIAGHSVCDMIEDLQEVANAALRALVNNMGLASGPQVEVNTSRLAPGENASELFPWKRWYVTSPPTGNATNEPAIRFFQPESRSQELLAVYAAANTAADELSGIPRYMTGSGVSGGAGRTSSGLAMLMGNAEKVLQTVAGNVDIDVMEPVLKNLYDLLMLTDTTGIMQGAEEVVTKGVDVAIQQEQERQKQLQFLQITANPIDAPIIGVEGRARVLRSVAQGLGLPDDIVPDDQEIADRQRQQQAVANAQAVAPAPGQSMPWAPNAGGGGAGGPPGSGGPGGPAAQAGAQAEGHQPPMPGGNTHGGALGGLDARGRPPQGGPRLNLVGPAVGR